MPSKTQKKKLSTQKKKLSANQKAIERIKDLIKKKFKYGVNLKNVSEDQIQQDFVTYISYKYPDVMYTSNGNFKGMNTVGYAKKMGYRTGWPDIDVDEARGKYHGIKFEIKKIDGKVKDHQEEVHKKLESKGYAVIVCYTLKDACCILDSYMKLSKNY